MRKPSVYFVILVLVILCAGCGGESANTGNVNTKTSTATNTTTNTSATPLSTPTPSGNTNAGNTSIPTRTKRTIDQILADLQTGNIAYNAPEIMVFEEPMTIQLLLSPNQSTEELSEMVREPGKIETARGIKITDEMEAQLTADPSAFKITAITLNRQSIPQNEPTEWRWEVTPLKSGRQKLALVINLIIDNNGREQKRTFKTYNKDIMVRVGFGKRTVKLISENWDWIWKALILPVGGGLLLLLRRHLNKRKLLKHKPSEEEIKKGITEHLTPQYKNPTSSDVAFKFGSIKFGSPTQSYFPKDHANNGKSVYPIRVPVTIVITSGSKGQEKEDKVERGKGRETFYFFKDDFENWEIEIR